MRNGTQAGCLRLLLLRQRRLLLVLRMRLRPPLRGLLQVWHRMPKVRQVRERDSPIRLHFRLAGRVPFRLTGFHLTGGRHPADSLGRGMLLIQTLKYFESLY